MVYRGLIQKIRQSFRESFPDSTNGLSRGNPEIMKLGFSNEELWRDEEQQISCKKRQPWDGIVVTLASTACTAAWRNWIDRESAK